MPRCTDHRLRRARERDLDHRVLRLFGRLELDRDRWTQIRLAVGKNSSIPCAADTIDWMWSRYASDAAVRLRRPSDSDRRSASLGRLISAVAAHGAAISRADYLDRWQPKVDPDCCPSLHEAMANEMFDQFAGAEGNSIDPALVCADADRLARVRQPTGLFVSNRIAHHNPAFESSLSYTEISAGIDVVGELFRRYRRLVRQVDLPIGPAIDNTCWGMAFTVAWMPAEPADTLRSYPDELTVTEDAYCPLGDQPGGWPRECT